MKKKWIALISFTIVLGIGITIYCLFFEHNRLSGVTSNGEWEVSYSKERKDQYWNGYVSKKTSEDAELKRVVFFVNRKEMVHYEQDEQEESAAHSDTVNIVWLGDAPEKNVQFEAVVEWNQNGEHHKERIKLTATKGS
ncbi:hypothetical protein MOF38_09660 [Bacillus haynesii]|uniref:hypothetical protein n=1 Tax=Bacillus haynesii TaxID=1925021 RepID=UPI002281E2BF|nr:hypothetical protein [Bacillus haynesii]MCY9278143.1 hypothetical protein [Bacillus haynesii]MCY9400053.1 hypothetical protein [Bacillus haynesii]MEC0706992.1 hypothetical protein [Bacillus haynesii]MEC0735444.1 hypothetical protein [Bacillus haynesii]